MKLNQHKLNSIELDQYKTIANVSEGIYREKGSKFLAFAHPVKTEGQIKELVNYYRKQYYDARHWCFAWELGLSGQSYRANDDGEPSGTAGKPILGQIHSFGLTNILVVVVRYFGGTKLGTSGLINAYKEAASDAINQAVIIDKTVEDFFSVAFNYAVMNDVMKLVKDLQLTVVEQTFELTSHLIFSVRKRDSDSVVKKFKKINQLKIEWLYDA